MARKSFKIPEVLTESEQVALLAQPNRRYPTGERNYVLIHLMLNTGLRLSEAIHLRWNDIELETGTLMVRQGKGGKDRTLWIGDADLELLQAWRDRQAKDVKGNPLHVFTTLDGRPVSPRYVQQAVKRYAAKAGIVKNVHPHMLRHSFATDLYRETGKIDLIQHALGHSRLATTEIYTHIVNPGLEAAMKSFRQPAAAVAV